MSRVSGNCKTHGDLGKSTVVITKLDEIAKYKFLDWFVGTLNNRLLELGCRRIPLEDTCVLSIIGTVELFYTTKGVAGALYTYFESFTIAMIIYFIMTFTCSRILRVLEHKMDGPDNYDLATADTLTHTSGMYSYRERKDDRE